MQGPCAARPAIRGASDQVSPACVITLVDSARRTALGARCCFRCCAGEGSDLRVGLAEKRGFTHFKSVLEQLILKISQLFKT